MRMLTRLALVVLALTLAGGPLLAAPLPLTAGAHLTDSHVPPASPVRSILTALGYGLAVFGAIKVKDTSAIAAKYVTRATGASKDYSDGVASAGSDWEAGAKAGEANFAQGVQEAIQDGRYGKGVNGSASKYVANATKLGATRYGPGVQNAQSAYTQGVQPYLDKLKSLTLPPKGPRRSPQNQQRAQMVALELGKLKTGK